MTTDSAPDLGPYSAAPPSAVDVTNFHEAREAWRCPELSAALGGPGDEIFHQGTVMRLDGDEHAHRRRTMGLLLRRRGHEYFRDTWLFPTADSSLSEALKKPDADGVTRMDLLAWARLVNQRLAAAITGFDDATSAEGAKELFELVDVVLKGRPGAFNVTMGQFDATTPEARAAIEARGAIIKRFYEPAIERRRTLVAKVAAGKLAETELPQDLLTLIAQGLEPAWDDPIMAERESIFLLSAGVHTTSMAMMWSLRELFLWLETHPEDLDRLSDVDFILRVAEESMRLHPVVPGFPRLATTDVDLSAGTHIPAGEIAVIRSGPASMEPAIYGEDADTFNPFRPVPAGVYNFGYAFGTGPHMCYGMPLVMGTGGLNGSLVYLLHAVLSAGVRPDPAHSVPSPAPLRGRYPDTDETLHSYPVIFPAAR